MGKAFGDNERNIIRNKLREGATECLQNFGVRKTTVDELVKRAGISKGAFYIFYPSKEALFFEVMTEFQIKLQNQFIKEATEKKDNLTSDAIAVLLYDLIKEVEHSFMITMLHNGDIDYLMRKLPENIIAAHQAEDDLLSGKLLKLFPCDSDYDKTALLSASFRAVAMTITAKKAIGEQYFDKVLMIMIKGIVNELYQK